MWGDNLHTDIGPTVCVKLAHDHTDSPHNHCASHCLQNMPFQGDNFNVCGVAVIISVIILTGCFNAIPIEETVTSVEKCWSHGFWNEKYLSIGLATKAV